MKNILRIFFGVTFVLILTLNLTGTIRVVLRFNLPVTLGV